MANVSLYNMKGESIGDINLSDDLFDVTIKENLVHASVVQYLANQRQGTKGTKTRAEVRGGGRKPWRQKGTGRARAGTIRSPIWVGGGVTFAPKQRDYSIKLNRKEKRQALKSVLTSKVQNEQIRVLDEIKIDEIKTKEIIKMLSNFDLNKVLIVTSESDKNVVLSARNIPNVKVATVNTINVYDLLKYENFLISKEAVEKIEEVYA